MRTLSALIGAGLGLLLIASMHPWNAQGFSYVEPDSLTGHLAWRPTTYLVAMLVGAFCGVILYSMLDPVAKKDKPKPKPLPDSAVRPLRQWMALSAVVLLVVILLIARGGG